VVRKETTRTTILLRRTKEASFFIFFDRRSIQIEKEQRPYNRSCCIASVAKAVNVCHSIARDKRKKEASLTPTPTAMTG
jgi:hypothetical protein